MKAKRIQLKRAKGWKMPPNCVSVARPSKWGNPFRIEWRPDLKLWEVVCFVSYGRYRDHRAAAKRAVDLYRQWLMDTPQGYNLRRDHLAELRGKDQACYCGPDDPCHAEVTLKIANARRRAND